MRRRWCRVGCGIPLRCNRPPGDRNSGGRNRRPAWPRERPDVRGARQPREGTPSRRAASCLRRLAWTERPAEFLRVATRSMRSLPHPSTGRCSRGRRRSPGSVRRDELRVAQQLARDRLAAVEHLELAVLDDQEPVAARLGRLPDRCRSRPGEASTSVRRRRTCRGCGSRRRNPGGLDSRRLLRVP